METQLADIRFPHDIEAEKSILATVFLDPANFDDVMVKLTPEDFYGPGNAEIFQAMKRLSMSGTVISKASVLQELVNMHRLEAAGGPAYIGSLVEYEHTSGGLAYLVEKVKSLSLRRKLLTASLSIAKDCTAIQLDTDTLLAEAEQKIFDLSREKGAESLVPMEKVVESVYQDIMSRHKTRNAFIGLRSGFTDLDTLTSGFQKGNLVIIAARPSMGKTALALNIAAHAALHEDKSVLIFSLEMSRAELGLRMLAAESGIDAKALKEGRLRTEDLDDFQRSVLRLSAARIYVDDTPALAVFDIRSRIRRMANISKCDLVIVDYLQLVAGSPDTARASREQEISEVSRMLKAIAKEFSVPVLALSQLNRAAELRKDKRPELADLRESGAIEQDADLIIFIYRDEYYNPDTQDKGIAELLVKKHRNGPTGVVKVIFQSNMVRFVNQTRTFEDISIR